MSVSVGVSASASASANGTEEKRGGSKILANGDVFLAIKTWFISMIRLRSNGYLE